MRYLYSVRKGSAPAIGQDLGSTHLGPRLLAQPRLDAGDARLEDGVIAKAFRFERPICPVDFEHVLARSVIESSFDSHSFVAARKEPDHRTFRVIAGATHCTVGRAQPRGRGR